MLRTPEVTRVAGGGRKAGPVGSERGSLALVTMFVLVAFGVTALLVPVVLGQVGQARHVQARDTALDAVHAGLQQAVASIRASNGAVASLPCTTITSQLTPSTGFQVELWYLDDDPRGRDDAWALANGSRCPTAATRFARIMSTGTNSGATRTVSATYQLRRGGAAPPGGRLYTFPQAGSVKRCLDAGSADPAAGAVLRMQDCLDGSIPQTFTYTAGYALRLNSSVTSTRPSGLCVQAAPSLGSFAALEPCADPRIPSQMWAVSDYLSFVGTSDGTTVNNRCLGSQTANSTGSTAGSLVVVLDTPACYSFGGNQAQFMIESGVGPGAASWSTGQLVNSAQYGRCLEIPGEDVAQPSLVAGQCKQALPPNPVRWNQRFTFPVATGRISTVSALDGKSYCVRSPGSPYDHATNRVYVAVVECPVATSPSDGLSWTVTRDTGTFATSYRVRNNDGYCLSVNDPTINDYPPFGHQISKVTVATCTSSALQKWAVPADFGFGTPLRDLAER